MFTYSNCISQSCLKVHSNETFFYMKARTCIPDSPSDPWFTDIPVGHNTLDKFLKQILTEASVDTTNKSNHSLRATAISRMYQKNVPEKLIMERSGHISREGVTSYERTTPAQQKAVCKMLSNVPEKPSPSADGIPLPEVHSLDATSSHSHPPPKIKQEDAIDTRGCHRYPNCSRYSNCSTGKRF